MKKFKKVLVLIPLFFVATTALMYLSINNSPQTAITVLATSFNMLPVLLFLLFVIFFSLVGFIYRSYRRGIMGGIFVVSFLLLRYFGYTNLFFTILLILIFLLFELFFTNTNSDTKKKS